jgi:hypothetical protein
MSLPASQQRALNQIEKTLADDHPSLGPMFAIFTGLTGHEAMPVIERVTARPWRWRWPMRPGVVIVVALAMVTGALLTLSLVLPSTRLCAPGTVTVATRTQAAAAGPQPAAACPTQQSTTQQNKPGKTSQSGFPAR